MSKVLESCGARQVSYRQTSHPKHSRQVLLWEISKKNWRETFWDVLGAQHRSQTHPNLPLTPESPCPELFLLHRWASHVCFHSRWLWVIENESNHSLECPILLLQTLKVQKIVFWMVSEMLLPFSSLSESCSSQMLCAVKMLQMLPVVYCSLEAIYFIIMHSWKNISV